MIMLRLPHNEVGVNVGYSGDMSDDHVHPGAEQMHPSTTACDVAGVHNCRTWRFDYIVRPRLHAPPTARLPAEVSRDCRTAPDRTAVSN